MDEKWATTKIAKKYGVWSNAINGLLRRRGIKIRERGEAHRIYPINENFFNNIDSEEKAYTLGLFYADGSVNEKKGSSYIMISESDDDILQKIKNIISPERPLLYYNTKNKKHQNRCMLCLPNKKIANKLSELGCCQNKTHKITFPKWLNKNLYNHFIRGYFDGDGHIGIYNKRNAKSKRLQFSICGTKSFLLSVKNIIEQNVPRTNIILYCRHPERNNNIRDLRVMKKFQIYLTLKWMYKDATIFMNRKYNKYREAEEEIFNMYYKYLGMNKFTLKS